MNATLPAWPRDVVTDAAIPGMTPGIVASDYDQRHGRPSFGRAIVSDCEPTSTAATPVRPLVLATISFAVTFAASGFARNRARRPACHLGRLRT